MHRRHAPDADAARPPDTTIAHHTPPPSAPEDPAFKLIKTLLLRAWQSPRVKIMLVLWVIGLFFMLFAPAVRTMTPELQQEYEAMVVDAADVPEYATTHTAFMEAQAYADEARVWFWRFRSPYNALVPKRQQVADKLQQELVKMDAIREQKMKLAKHHIGLWSELGMAEVRQRFWEAFDRGKMFAKQQTFYHMLMDVLSTRDEEVVSTILNWIVVAVVNFTTGLVGSLFFFAYSAISMVFSYQPDPMSATAFIVLALVGGASVVASYLLVLYGVVGTGVYVVGKAAARNALEQERRERLRAQQHYQ